MKGRRFVYRRIGKGNKKHIFPKYFLRKALCLRGPANTNVGCADLEACKICRKQYPAVSRSAIFQMFIG